MTCTGVIPISRFPTCLQASATTAAGPTTIRGPGRTSPSWSCTRSTFSKTAWTSRIFKFVHKTPIVPVFTRHDFDAPVSYVDFTITFEGDEQQSIDNVKSGVEAINGGPRVAVTKSSGMVDSRTSSPITPVDEYTSDVRFTVYIGRSPGSEPARAEIKAQEFGQEIIRQFAQDVHIWAHQRYSDPPALASSEFEGFTAIRNWAKQSIPTDVAHRRRVAVHGNRIR